MFDYYRIACAVPEIRPADVENNLKEICKYIEQAESAGVDVVLFPELCVTGFTCGDLFCQETLINASNNAVNKIAEFTTGKDLIAVIGAPVRFSYNLYDCAVIIYNGRVEGVVPKTFCDRRWFTSANPFDKNCCTEQNIFGCGCVNGEIAPGQKVFTVKDGFKFSVVIGEDATAPAGITDRLALKGAEVVLNMTALEQLIGCDEHVKLNAQGASYKNICVYAACSAGRTESTADSVFSGISLVAQNGRLLKANEQFIDSGYILTVDVDLGAVRADRAKSESFKASASMVDTECILEKAIVVLNFAKCNGELLNISKMPFTPYDAEARIDRCCDIFNIQVEALKRRVQILNSKLVIGISGGLDSTLALLVAVECMKRLGRPVSDVHGITMPCFGTSDRTLNNSLKLMDLLGVTSKTISIKDACIQHFNDIEHSLDNYDATYENAQARERTQVLMDYAGKIGGFVVGTGDLSELALGWCTYNGDHMSMYSVNCDVPKTLVRQIVASLVECGMFADCNHVLKDILYTPISPELLPPDAKGNIAQVTEDIVGPYVLHDFFLYYIVRYGYEPKKIFNMAKRAFDDDFDSETIKKWLKSFYKRFFSQQFKRNCVPDGVKVGSISLSPRGDFRMPSDAVSSIWQAQVDEL